MPPRDTDPLIEIIRQGGEDRREQTAVLRQLVVATEAHNQGAQARHDALLAALTRQDAAAAEASWTRRAIATAAKEVWPTFRTPLGMLVTGICTYWVWQLTGAAPTPTPVVVAPSAPSAPSPAEGLALEIAVPTP